MWERPGMSMGGKGVTWVPPVWASKNILRNKTAVNPEPSMLMAQPITTWGALKRMEATAKIRVMKQPASIPASMPSQ